MGHQTRLRLNDHPPLTFVLRYRSPRALYHPFRHQNLGRCLRKHHLYPYQIQRQHRQKTAYLSSDFNLSSLQAICPPHPHVASRLLHRPGLGQRLKIRKDTRILASSPSTYSGTGSSLGSREDEDEDEEVDDEDNGEDVSSLSDASFHTATATIDSLDYDERLGEPDDDHGSSSNHGDEDEQAGNSTQVGVDNHALYSCIIYLDLKRRGGVQYRCCIMIMKGQGLRIRHFLLQLPILAHNDDY